MAMELKAVLDVSHKVRHGMDGCSKSVATENRFFVFDGKILEKKTTRKRLQNAHSDVPWPMNLNRLRVRNGSSFVSTPNDELPYRRIEALGLRRPGSMQTRTPSS